MSPLAKALDLGRPLIGSWINTCSPVAAELMAAAGFDFLAVDAEHAAVDVPQGQALFQAIGAGNPWCAPLVRLPDLRHATIKRFMDAGAVGVIAPQVNSAKQAHEVVSAVKYPPLGSRGVGFARANLYGMLLHEAVASANDQTMVCLQIEHVSGVENIEQILGVTGVDAIFIGPYDLSASMGLTGQFDHPVMRAATDRVLDACARHEVAAGIHVIQPDVDEVVRHVDEGYRLIAYSLDITMLLHQCRTALRHLQERLEPWGWKLHERESLHRHSML